MRQPSRQSGSPARRGQAWVSQGRLARILKLVFKAGKDWTNNHLIGRVSYYHYITSADCDGE